ncbi:MAG: DHH family phosphoesterase [bacterium]
MDVITTHTNADFDAIASIVAAAKLYPSAKKVLSGSCEAVVKSFLFQNPQGILKSKQISLKDIKRLILVDTREKRRIGKFSQIKDIPIYIYDHHPNQPDDISGDRVIVKEYGATITILLEYLKKKKIKITKEEASLFCLGIYEDTGSLTFPTTRKEDISSVLWLLKKGADLSFVSSYLNTGPSKDEIILLSKLLASTRVYKINNIDIAFSFLKIDKYIGDLAILAHRMMDIEGFSCLFILIKKEDHIHIIARSRIKDIDVGAILSDFGGGGHPEAGSATIKERSILELKRMLISRIRRNKRNLLFLIEAKVPSFLRDFIDEASKLADEMKVSCYIIGGFVRDLIMGKVSKSLDILIVGDGILFAKKLSERLSLDCIFHPKFKTAQILKNGIKIDIATSRSEVYRHPGALPLVKEASLKKDLKRRDFTMNTLGIFLNKRGKGNLIDVYGGCDDIKDKRIKILHKKSFIDDPTRILRAVRFESRLGFKMDRETEKEAFEAIKNGYLSHISKPRIRNELWLILSDERPQKAFLRLSKLGGLNFIHQGLRVNKNGFLRASEALLQASILEDEIDISLLHLLVLVDSLTKEEAEKFLFRLRFSSKIRRDVLRIKEDKEILLFLKNKSLKNSAIYERLNKMPLEGLVFIMSKTRSIIIKKRVFLFLTVLRKTSLYLTGDYLKKRGIKPGPIYKKILRELFYLKLDGKIKTKNDEVKFLELPQFYQNLS